MLWKQVFSPIMMLTAVLACLTACTTSKVSNSIDETQKLSPRLVRVGDPVPKGGGNYMLGAPYLAGGKWYTPVVDVTYDKVGQASWYGDFFHGRQTANGEIYDMNALTAAHPTFPLPAYAKVTNLANNRTVIVRVNDRGPYARDRIIDLSRRAAELLDFHNHGTATVRVQYYGPAPINGDDSFERNYVARMMMSSGAITTTPATPQTASWSTKVEPAQTVASVGGAEHKPSSAMLASAVKTTQASAKPAQTATVASSTTVVTKSAPSSATASASSSSTFAVTEVMKTSPGRSESLPSFGWSAQSSDVGSRASFSGQ